MQFQESVETCIARKYADFEGMATRSEFWWFALFVAVVQAVLWRFSWPLAAIFALAMVPPCLAVGARRLRDTGRDPSWLLIGLLVPVGELVLLVFFTERGRSPTTPT